MCWERVRVLNYLRRTCNTMTKNKMDKRTNNDLQKNTQKIKIIQTLASLCKELGQFRVSQM
jgi:hypothetical protein